MSPPTFSRLRDVRHRVFISYSRGDQTTAAYVYSALKGVGLPAWMDHYIAPGTPDWEARIRGAMRECMACVLVASSHAKDSPYVRAELALARAQGIPVFPIWVSGEDWSESVPLEFIAAQRIDVRPGNDPAKFEAMAAMIAEQCRDATPPLSFVERMSDEEGPGASEQHLAAPLDDLPAGCASIALDARDGRTAIVRLNSFIAIGQLLNLLYTEALAERFRPYTYAKSWVIQRINRTKLKPMREALAPFEWVAGQDVEGGVHDWNRLQPAAIGLLPGTYWQITEANPADFVGFAFKTEGVAYWFEHGKIAYSMVNSEMFEALAPPLAYDPAWRYRVVPHAMFHGLPADIIAARTVVERDDVDRARYEQYREEYLWSDIHARYPGLDLPPPH